MNAFSKYRAVLVLALVLVGMAAFVALKETGLVAKDDKGPSAQQGAPPAHRAGDQPQGGKSSREKVDGQDPRRKAAQGSPQGASGPPSGAGGRGPVGGATPVVVEKAGLREFSEIVPAIGNARAFESVVISSKITEVIKSLPFKSGQRVSKGQVLVELSSVEQQADLAEDEAALIEAASRLTRNKELAERGLVSQARIDELQANHDRAKAAVDASKARIADRVIRAPFSGIMGLRQASPGQLARPGDPIATLDDVSVIKLDFETPERFMTLMKPGATIEAETTAYPGAVFRGTIAEIDTRVELVRRTFVVRALIPNKDNRLKPGMLMQVRVKSSVRKSLAAPEIALVELGDGVSVYVIGEKDGAPVAQPAKIDAGLRQDGFVEVRSGLQVGDRIIVEGVSRVRPNGPVRIQDPNAKPKPDSAEQGVPKGAPAPGAVKAGGRT